MRRNFIWKSNLDAIKDARYRSALHTNRQASLHALKWNEADTLFRKLPYQKDHILSAKG